MNRYLRLISASLPFFAAEAIQYITYSLLLLLIPIEPNVNINYIYSIIGILVSGIVFGYWYLQENRGEIRIRIHQVFTIKNIGLLLLLGIGCQLFFSGAMSLILPYLKQLFTEYNDIIRSITTGNYGYVLLLILFVAPITEELIFRGVILSLAQRQITFLGANLFQAVLFGIYHGNIVQGIYAILIGFLLGLMRHKFKTIYAPILLHIIINGSSILVPLFPATRVFTVIMLIMGVILFIIAFILLKPLSRALRPSD